MELKFTECQAKKRQKAQRLWVISIGIASTLLLAGGLAFFLLGDFGRDDGLDDLPFESTVPAIRQEVTISGVKQVLAVYEASAADESMTADEAKGIQKVVSVLSEIHDHRVILDAELEISMEIDPLLKLKIDREAWGLVPAETRFQFKQVLRLRLGDVEFEFVD